MNATMEDDKLLKNNLESITKAIRRKSSISFVYSDNEKKIIEPVILGIDKETGKHVIRGYKSFPLELHDKKENWLLFEVEKMQKLQVTPMRIKKVRKGFRAEDEAMSEIILMSAEYKLI